MTLRNRADHPLADGNLLLNNQLKNPSKISAYDFVKSKSNDTIGDGVIKDFTKVEETPTGKAPLKISNEVKKETRIGLSKNKRLAKYTDSYVSFDTQFSDLRNLLEPTTDPATVKDHIKFKFSIKYKISYSRLIPTKDRMKMYGEVKAMRGKARTFKNENKFNRKIRR